jgi:hypothetical protein
MLRLQDHAENSDRCQDHAGFSACDRQDQNCSGNGHDYKERFHAGFLCLRKYNRLIIPTMTVTHVAMVLTL